MKLLKVIQSAHFKSLKQFSVPFYVYILENKDQFIFLHSVIITNYFVAGYK